MELLHDTAFVRLPVGGDFRPVLGLIPRQHDQEFGYKLIQSDYSVYCRNITCVVLTIS